MPAELAARWAALALLAGFVSACQAQRYPEREPDCDADWRLLYRHDADGERLTGSKQELFDAVRSGAPVRFLWGFRGERDGETISVEHAAEPVFLTIASGRELVVQLPEHIGQASYFDPDATGFESSRVLWRGLMSTDGTFDAVWVDRATGEEVRRLPQRVGLSWFARVPPDGCEPREALEIATPGGVRRRD